MNPLRLALPLFALLGAAAQAQATDTARQPLTEQRQQLRQLQLEGQQLQRLNTLSTEDRARYGELTERRAALQAELLALQVRALTARNEALRGGASAAAATVALEEVLGTRGRELQTELRALQNDLAELTRSAMPAWVGAALPGRALPPQAAPRAMQQLRQRMQQLQRQQQQRMPQHRPPQQRR